MLKCNVCGHEFPATVEGHYIARDEGVTGILLGAHDEEKLHDAWDCPYCGAQYVAQERKRKYVAPTNGDEVERNARD